MKKKNIKPMFWPTEKVIILINKDNKTCKTYVTTILSCHFVLI